MGELLSIDLPFGPIVIAVLAFFILSIVRSQRRNQGIVPPSPPGDFLIGHALRLPADYQWKTLAQWGKEYGDLLYIHYFGRPVVICNSFEAARDLLEKRGHNYSERPIMRSGEAVGMGSMMTLLQYGDRWRRQRRLMQVAFGQRESLEFRPGIKEEVERFITDICNFEGDIRGLVHRLVASALCLAAFGHKVTSPDDEIVKLMEEVDELSKTVGAPGSTLVDVFPPLRFIPAWIPGVTFPRRFAKGKALVAKVFIEIISLVRKERELGTSRKAMLPVLLEYLDGRSEKSSEEEEDVASIGAVAFFAGFETSESVLYTFFLLMVLHPEVQRRAQHELDGFTESNRRLPLLEDRAQLPFLDCIVKEVYRFYPPTPLGIPHRSLDEDIYEGWKIPAGSMIVTNLWQMMREEHHFPEPDRFIPARFLNDEGGAKDDIQYDPSKLVFGFGRRSCPGRFFADDLVWLSIANVLAVFDIHPSTMPQTGEPRIPIVEFESATISLAKPYLCRVSPRSESHEGMIMDIAVAREEERV